MPVRSPSGLVGRIIDAGALAFVHPQDKYAKQRIDALAQRITCGALLASINTASEYGFGGVIAARYIRSTRRISISSGVGGRPCRSAT